jgi:hypothetical protein
MYARAIIISVVGIATMVVRSNWILNLDLNFEF